MLGSLRSHGTRLSLARQSNPCLGQRKGGRFERRWLKFLYNYCKASDLSNVCSVLVFARLGVECSTVVIANVLVWKRSVRCAHTARAIKLGQYLTKVIANV